MSTVRVPDFSSSNNDPTMCSNCPRGIPFQVHRVPAHRTYVNLCSPCILCLYPQLFCPTCYSVYESPIQESVVICSECGCSTHGECVMSKAPLPYVCPNCIDPNSLIHGLDKNSYRLGSTIMSVAAKIVVILTRNVADAAWVEAVRKAELAVRLRKIAKEALEISENLSGDRVNEFASMSAEEPGSISGRVGRKCGRDRVCGLAAGDNNYERGAGGGHGGIRGLDAVDFDSDCSDADSDSDPDYDGSNRTCKRKKVAQQGKSKF